MAISAAVYHLLFFQLCVLASSAALPPSQPLSLLNNYPSIIKPPFNITQPNPSNALPAEGYYYSIPPSTVSVKFYHYGDNLRDAIATQQVLAAAFEDAVSHPPDQEIATAKLQYSQKHTHTVDLVLLPEPTMNWHMWRYAVLGLGAFMQLWDNVWLSFDVEVAGMKERVGTGYVFKNYDEG